MEFVWAGLILVVMVGWSGIVMSQLSSLVLKVAADGLVEWSKGNLNSSGKEL